MRSATGTKGSNVVVTRSTFIGNQAVARSLLRQPRSDHAAARSTPRTWRRCGSTSSLFPRNRADVGGAVDDYRAVVEIHGSVFQGNQTHGGKPVGRRRAGLSPPVFDSDFDQLAPSTAGPPGWWSLSRCSRGEASGPAAARRRLHPGRAATARAMFGGGAGAPRRARWRENRAQVEIRGTIFSDCDVQPGRGRQRRRAAAPWRRTWSTCWSRIRWSSTPMPAAPQAPAGGVVALRQESNARIARTTFARNSADQLWRRPVRPRLDRAGGRQPLLRQRGCPGSPRP